MAKEHIFAPKAQKTAPSPTSRTHGKEGASSSADTTSQSRAELAVALQRSVGNRAVRALLGDPSAGPTGTVAVQRDLVSDVKSKLEYGLFGNWVITDAKAKAALSMLEGASVSQRTAAAAAIKDALVERLLENLPDNARSGEAFSHLVALLSSAAAGTYTPNVVAGGSFRWAVDAPARFFTYVFDRLDDSSRNALLTRANNLGQWRSIVAKAGDAEQAKLVKWLQALPRGSALSQQQKDLIRVVFNNSPDGQLATLLWCVAVRFNVAVGKSSDPTDNGQQWDAAGLRRMYPVIEALPAGHVEKNPSLKKLSRYLTTSGVSGWYGRKGEAAIGYNSGALNDIQNSDVGDALKGVNRFNKVIRHEVGHAVDRQMGWSAGSQPADNKRGGWKQYGANYASVAADMVADSAGGITSALTPEQRADVLTVIATDLGARTPGVTPANVRALPWYSGLPRPKRKAVMDDPVFPALRAAFNNPWYREAGGGPHLGSYVYEESYNNDWNRYRHDARGRKVSQYQFRAPGEWFAEAYAAYYEPDDRGRGARLGDNDKDTKKYFDDSVHTHGS